MIGKIALVGAACAALGLTAQAEADAIYTASGSIDIGGGNFDSASAKAVFSLSGNTLTITLTNTSSANAQETPTNTLTGIAFSFQNVRLALTPVSAISPSAIFDSADCASGEQTVCATGPVNVAGEWGLDNGTYSSASDVVASAGYITTGLMGDIGNFNAGAAGTNLAGPNALDGIQMGILSSTHGTLNGGLSGNALIMDTVVLTLTGVSNDLVGQSLDNLTGISFLYGTSPDATLPGTVTITEDSGAGPAPEPATLGILGTSLLGLAAVRRRSRR